MEPVKLLPAFQDYLWGGERLRTRYGKKTDLDPIAESWELSCNDHGLSRVDGTDETLKGFLARQDQSFLGTSYDFSRDFPILIKLIDSRKSLSLQVHPSDSYALEHEGSYGKTEMWVVIDCDPGSTLYYGLNHDCTKEELRAAIEQGTMEKCLNQVLVRPGDVFFIPPGTIHAIGAGILLAEIQQNSDITYRLYDYGRRDAHGNLRRLDIDKGLEVSNLKAQRLDRTRPASVGCMETLAHCPYFTTCRVRCDGAVPFTTDTAHFEVLLVTDGQLRLCGEEGSMELRAGECALLPAALGAYTAEGHSEYLRVFPGNVSM